MSVTTTNRRACIEEIAAEMDRRGQVVERLEARNDDLTKALRDAERAIAEFYRYHTGGETRGSYDGRPEREGLWKAMRAARSTLAALVPAPQPVGEVREAELMYEVWQDDIAVAGSTSLAEAKHYLAVYGQDGPVELVEATTFRRRLASAAPLVSSPGGLAMKVRTLIPKRLDPMDDPAHATVIANLVSAGFRLLGPDELDPVTVERCAEIAKTAIRAALEGDK